MPSMTGKFPEITLTCGHCASAITTRAAAGSSARCPGCGRTKKVPAGRASTVATPRPGSTVEAIGWEPAPLERDEVEDSGDDCPTCGDPVFWEPAATLLWCDTCDLPVFPPGLVAVGPVEGDPRRVATQAERDDAALELAERRAVVLYAVERVLIAPDLSPDCRGRFGWYAEEIRAAATMHRLDELVERLSDEQIRRAAGSQTQITAGAVDEDEDDLYDEYEDEQDEPTGSDRFDGQAPALPVVSAVPVPRLLPPVGHRDGDPMPCRTGPPPPCHGCGRPSLLAVAFVTSGHAEQTDADLCKTCESAWHEEWTAGHMRYVRLVKYYAESRDA